MQQVIPASLVLALMLAAGAVSAQSVSSFQDGSDREGQSSGELFFVIQELRQEVRRLQGQLEEQANQIERLNRQGRERYVDLDERLVDVGQRLSTVEDGMAKGSSAAGSGPGLSQGGSGNLVAGTVDSGASRDRRNYRQPDDAERAAYGIIQKRIHEEKDYDRAADAVYDFVEKYPEGDLTVNAYYWLGEIYLIQKNLDQARRAFSIVVSRYDDHRKAPDALYKLAVTQQQRGDKEDARRSLEQVIARYPNADAAPLARNLLGSL
ncbi:MAG: tol-pal system protein YbgF [Halomonadaceae bacterium]|nr:MAG: tol-pal system protein YbgF [Halomonadaceae bacterium]